MTSNVPVWRATSGVPGVAVTMFEPVRAAIRRVRARIPTLAELIVGDATYDISLHTPVPAPPPAPTSAHGVVSVGALPTGVAVNPEGTRVYVVNSGDDSVSVIDTDTATAAVTIAVGRSPYGIALTPDGRTAYVANAGGNSVSAIDTRALAVTATIPVGENPYGVAVAPDGERVYVTNQADGSLSVIDASSLLFAQALIGNKSTIAVGIAPTGVAVSADGRAYVVDNESHSLIVVDTAAGKVTDTIPVGKRPAQVAITPDGAQAFVTNAGGGSVSVVDLATTAVSETLLVSDHPIGVAIGADGRFAYVTALDASLLAGTVTVIDIETGETNTRSRRHTVRRRSTSRRRLRVHHRFPRPDCVDGNGRRRIPRLSARFASRRNASPAIAIDRGSPDVVVDPEPVGPSSFTPTTTRSR